MPERTAAGACAGAGAGAGAAAGATATADQATADPSAATATAAANSAPDDATKTSPMTEATIRAALPDEIGSINAPGGGTADDVIASLAALAEALEDSTRSTLVFDPFLVRGMGYYTGTIFEISHPELGYSLGGGGRYDGMIGRFLGTDVPAVGFSIGFERIVDLVELPDSDTADSVVLLYDADVAATTLTVLKSQLIASGSRVRLERRAKNTRLQLETLAAAGFTRYATVTAADAGTATDAGTVPATGTATAAAGTTTTAAAAATTITAAAATAADTTTAQTGPGSPRAADLVFKPLG
jgi:histidyl-tRNA synthetase